jgi:glycolate oxidase iron-sulfur subunit
MNHMPVKPETFISAAADQCVKCGLCLPRCPSYRLLRNEADSPRGRIALMQGLAQGQLQADKQLLQHLDRCLGCQACEKVCPSGVQYSQLLDTTRDWIESGNHRPWPNRLLRKTGLLLLSQSSVWRRSWRLLRWYQRSGLQALLRSTGLLRLTRLKGLDDLLPEIKKTTTLPTTHPATTIQRGRVGLFNGCMEDIVSATLRQDTIRLLNHAGYDVMIPASQGCCGALHQHNGDLHQAQTLAQSNIEAFKQYDLDTVLYLSSGCGTTLKDYPRLTEDHTSSAPLDADNKTPVNFIEALQFLNNSTLLQSGNFRPLTTTIAWLSPCSQRYSTGGQQASRQLLAAIPAMKIIELDNDCCGAAGSYMLTQPEIATALRAEVLAPFKNNAIRTLVTANVGCAMHLANGLRQQGLDVEVIHPLTLLARQLKTGLEA